MNNSATELPPELVDILSDIAHYPDLEGTATRFEQARRTRSRLQLGLAESELNFQDSLKLKNKLDELETYGSDGEYLTAQSTPWRLDRSTRIRANVFAETNTCRGDILPTLINCEYILWKLNADTPLRQNPFLSHWVEVCQRWSSRLNKLYETDKNCALAEDAYVWRNVHRTRLVVVKAVLTESLHKVRIFKPGISRHEHHAPTRTRSSRTQTILETSAPPLPELLLHRREYGGIQTPWISPPSSRSSKKKASTNAPQTSRGKSPAATAHHPLPPRLPAPPSLAQTQTHPQRSAKAPAHLAKSSTQPSIAIPHKPCST